MARKRCPACQQFYGPASVHRCPSTVPAAAPTPVGGSLPPSTLAQSSQVTTTPYQGVFAPGEAQEYAIRVEAAMRVPSDPQDAKRLAGERALIEARFGSIDWSS